MTKGYRVDDGEKGGPTRVKTTDDIFKRQSHKWEGRGLFVSDLTGGSPYRHLPQDAFDPSAFPERLRHIKDKVARVREHDQRSSCTVNDALQS